LTTHLYEVEDSGPAGRFRKVFEFDNGTHCATLWDIDQNVMSIKAVWRPRKPPLRTLALSLSMGALSLAPQREYPDQQTYAAYNSQKGSKRNQGWSNRRTKSEGLFRLFGKENSL
jgi:hypothetical protein